MNTDHTIKVTIIIEFKGNRVEETATMEKYCPPCFGYHEAFRMKCKMMLENLFGQVRKGYSRTLMPKSDG